MCGSSCFCRRIHHWEIVTATGFTSHLGSVPNLPVANVLYAYDTTQGTVILLECNNGIYLGDKMSDSLMNPIQAEEVDVVWILVLSVITLTTLDAKVSLFWMAR